MEAANTAIAPAIVKRAFAFTDKVKPLSVPAKLSRTPLKLSIASPTFSAIVFNVSTGPPLAIIYTKLPPKIIVKISPIPTLSLNFVPMLVMKLNNVSLNLPTISKASLKGPVILLVTKL